MAPLSGLSGLCKTTKTSDNQEIIFMEYSTEK